MGKTSSTSVSVAPTRDGLEILAGRIEDRQAAALPDEQLGGHQGDDPIGLLLRLARLQQVVHAVEQGHLAVAPLQGRHQGREPLVRLSAARASASLRAVMSRMLHWITLV